MICRAYLLQLGFLIIGMFAWLPAARAQSPVIPDADKISASAGRDKIQPYLEYYLNNVTGSDNALRNSAHQALVQGARITTPQQTISAAYLDTYADALNELLKPMAANQQFQVRLNAAVVAARVAEYTNNARLQEVVTTLLADKNEGIQLWALRAAKNVLPAALNNDVLLKRPSTLIPAIIEVARQHPTGPIIFETYNALSLNARSAKPAIAVTPEMIAIVVPQLHEVMRIRIAQYAAGKVSEPIVERDACATLVHLTIWTATKPPLRTANLQVMLDLIAIISARADEAAGPTREDLALTVKEIAKCFRALIIQKQLPNNGPLDTAVRSLEAINPTAPAKISPLAPPLAKALQEVDKGIKPPPPTTAPATAPATQTAGK